MEHVYVNKVGGIILAGTVKMGGASTETRDLYGVSITREMGCEIETQSAHRLDMPPLRRSDFLTCVHVALSFLWPNR
jgi:hypothetical protein